jgi:Flp pilus assembly protein TadG
MKHLNRLLKSQRGTSMIEFAVTAPVFALLLVGLVDVGRYTYYGILAAHAAHSGAWYGAQNLQTAADVNTNNSNSHAAGAAAADAQSLSNWTVHAMVVCTNNNQSSPCPANNTNSTPPAGLVYFIKVQVTGTFTPLIAYPGISSIPVSATAIQRVVTQ